MIQLEDDKCCLFPCLQSFCTNCPSALKAVERDMVEEKQPYPVASIDRQNSSLVASQRKSVVTSH
jgi:hypothetical protein